MTSERPAGGERERSRPAEHERAAGRGAPAPTGDPGSRGVPRSGPVMRAEHEAWMRMALAVAEGARESGDIPVGAVVLSADGEVLGLGRNIREAAHDPTGHAEVVALRAAAQALGRWRLENAILVVTLEPCAMCAGAAVAARVGRIVFGAWDEKAGACGSVWDLVRDRAVLHRPEVHAGVFEAECRRLLTDFFAEHRQE